MTTKRKPRPKIPREVVEAVPGAVERLRRVVEIFLRGAKRRREAPSVREKNDGQSCATWAQC